MLIDAHNHLGPRMPFLSTFRKADELLNTMDKAGVEKALVQQHVSDLGYMETLIEGLEYISRAVGEHPDRLFGCALVHPLVEDSLILAKKALDAGAVNSLKIWPGADYQPTPERMRLIMEIAREYGVPVRVHGDIDDPRSSPLALVALCNAYPDVSVILAHLPGEYTLDGLATVAAGLAAPNIHFDTSTCHSSMIGRAIVELGADRILWGSDSPWWDIEIELEKIRVLSLSPNNFAMVTGGNAMRLFRLGRSR
jgi:predicted TIM-barrel fold metal-dependent hydrolase